ncbi:glycotransferase [Candidatus Photodesmus blepharus]|uniref:Glycotransferase n=1 Tax=Candidatus Photodesmus blepharonis TaxID=1179155 RepID=A0A084CPL2_9GAMM|nr:glycosyltransferase family 2 protein [Candidatus Photodesmus blepharus]KEY91741.1 glycotransferase [Candidatus Photodesmus blepharus]
MIEVILINTWIISVLLIVYHHVGYPWLLRLYSKYHPPIQITNTLRGYKISYKDKVRPSITIIVPAYNESCWIADKIRNLAVLDYPKKQLKIIILCDGCQDNTVDIAQDTIQEAICCDTHFEIISFEKNRGKTTLINKIMPSISSDITALSDVSALISIDSLLIAEQNFYDKKVGVVSGSYSLLDDDHKGALQYWQYQNQIKQNEANLCSVLGAHGALYLFRTHLFKPFPPNAINDDFILPMEIVRNGYRANYETGIRAIELEATSRIEDFKRRIRISAGNMQQVIQFLNLLNPQNKAIAFAFFSGKGLRLAIPYLMIFCLIASAALIEHPLFLVILITQIALYGIILLSFLFPYVFHHKIFQLATYFIVGHCANFIGGLRYLLGLESGQWTRINH